MHCWFRYCQLLGFSEEDFYEELALVCAKQGKQDQAVEICWSVNSAVWSMYNNIPNPCRYYPKISSFIKFITLGGAMNHNAFCYCINYYFPQILTIFSLSLCRDLVNSSPRPSVALLVMAVVQEVWERAVSQPESISREDVRAVRKLAAHATTLCHQCMNSLCVCVYECVWLCIYVCVHACKCVSVY